MNIKTNRNLQTIINLASSILCMGIGILINFFLSPYIVNHLGAEANGFVQLANNFVMYASLITIALNSMAARFITISYHKDDIKLASKYYSSIIIGNILVIAVLIIPALLCILKLDKLINISPSEVNNVKLLFMFVFINFFVNQLTGIFTISTYATNKLYIQNLINAVKISLNALLLFTVFMLFPAKIYYVSGVALLLSLFELPTFITVKRKILNKLSFSIKNFSFKYIWQLVISGVWNTVNQCGNLLMTGLDLLIANLFIDPASMGLLAISKTIPNTIVMLGTTINTTFSPNLTIAYACGEKEEILKQLRMSMKISSILLSIPIIVFSVFGINFYTLWMPTLDAKMLVTLSFLTCMTFIPFSGPQVLYNVFTTTNKLSLNSILFLISGVLNLIIVFFLVKLTNMGIYAVAGVSSTISIARNLIFTVPYTAKILNLKWYEFYKDVAMSLVCCAVVFVFSVIVRLIMPANSWIMLIISVFVACTSSFVANALILLSKNEKTILKNKIFRKKIIKDV